MKVVQIIQCAIKNIVHNKLRTFLTMLGLIIGISSVIVLVGIGDGTNSQVNDELELLGTDMLKIEIANETGIKDKELNDLKKEENIKAIAPYKNIYSKTVSKDEKYFKKANIIATNEDVVEAKNMKVKQGRNLNSIDLENKNKICVIGVNVVKELFGYTNPIGQTIKIDGDKYTVVGILDKQGESMGTNIDNLVLVPFSIEELNEKNVITMAYIKVKDEKNMQGTINRLENKLKNEYGIAEDEISIASQESMRNKTEKINNSLSILLGGIAGISLIVGGIGVMNVMLVSVTERTKEIGIRKSVGAKRSDILVQFLAEAFIISIIGGMLGIILGILIGQFTEEIGFRFILSSRIVIIAFLASSMTGLVFGIFPAYRASCLSPIEALRE